MDKQVITLTLSAFTYSHYPRLLLPLNCCDTILKCLIFSSLSWSYYNKHHKCAPVVCIYVFCFVSFLGNVCYGKTPCIGLFMALLFEKLNVILVVATESESVYVVCYSLNKFAFLLRDLYNFVPFHFEIFSNTPLIYHQNLKIHLYACKIIIYWNHNMQYYGFSK